MNYREFIIAWKYRLGGVGRPSAQRRLVLTSYLTRHSRNIPYPNSVGHPEETPQLRDRLLLEQRNRCACCGISHDEYHLKYGIDCGKPKSRTKCFVLDHDHKTGLVRATICQVCNSDLWYYLRE